MGVERRKSEVSVRALVDVNGKQTHSLKGKVRFEVAKQGPAQASFDIVLGPLLVRHLGVVLLPVRSPAGDDDGRSVVLSQVGDLLLGDGSFVVSEG